MSKYFSPSAGGFYASEIHGDAMPADVVEISEEAWRDLLRAQQKGQRIVARADGAPVAVDPEPDVEALAHRMAIRREVLLAETDWTQLLDAPLSDEQRAAWRAYRQALRDLPAQPGFPTSIIWPDPPASQS